MKTLAILLFLCAACANEGAIESHDLAGREAPAGLDTQLHLVAESVLCSEDNTYAFLQNNFPESRGWQISNSPSAPPARPTETLYSVPPAANEWWIYYLSNSGHPTCTANSCDYTMWYQDCKPGTPGTCTVPVSRGNVHCNCIGGNGGLCAFQ